MAVVSGVVAVSGYWLQVSGGFRVEAIIASFGRKIGTYVPILALDSDFTPDSECTRLTTTPSPGATKRGTIKRLSTA
jgi:hypothetical protein